MKSLVAIQVLLAASFTIVLTVVSAAVPLRRQAAPVETASRWYKGNTHTHTLNSDGDSTPDDVVRWYREHGYQFLVLTDHNFLTSVDGLNALHGADEQFLVIKGEEVSDRSTTRRSTSTASTSVRVCRRRAARRSSTCCSATWTRFAGRRVPHIKHPNFLWAISAEQLRQVPNNRLFEIFNGHPQVNNSAVVGFPDSRRHGMRS